MSDRINRNGSISGALVVLLGLFMASAAGAADSGNDRQGGSMDSILSTTTNGVQDVVEAIDAQNGTIVLGTETFRVSSSSVLLDIAGRNIHLGELRDGTTGDPDYVEFVATSGTGGGMRTIQRLQVMDGDFE